MMPEPAPIQDETEDSLRDEQMSDPDVQARVKQIFEDAKQGKSGPGITAEELPDFLREQRS
jgi:hypothetical protein